MNSGYSINTYMKTDIDESPVGDLKRFIQASSRYDKAANYPIQGVKTQAGRKWR